MPEDAGERRAEVLRVRDSGRHVEAESLARELLSDVRDAQGDSTAAFAEALDLVVECILRTRSVRDSTSLELARQATELKLALYGPDHLELAHSLTNLAALLDEGGLGDAGPVYRQALAIVDATTTPGDPEVARVHAEFAIYMNGQEEYAVAKQHLETALAILAAHTPADSSMLAYVLNNYGISYWKLGDYQKARIYWERLLEIRKRAGPNSMGVASALNSLAAVHVETGDFRGALQLYEESYRIRALTPDAVADPLMARVKSNIAEMQLKLGALDSAATTYHSALDIARGAQDDELIAKCLHGLGRVDQELRSYAAAQSYFQQALALREHMGKHRAARTMHYLARLDYTVGETDTALALCQRALALRTEVLGDGHPETAESKALLAAILNERGLTSSAVELAQDAERTAADHVRLTSRSLAEREALMYAEARERGLDVLVQIAATRPDLAPKTRIGIWDTVVHSRALVLDEMTTRNRQLAQSTDPEVTRLIEEVQTASSHLANLILRGSSKDAAMHERELASARARRDDAERELSKHSQSFRLDRARERVGYADVTRHLPDMAALVSYVSYVRRTRDVTPSGTLGRSILSESSHLAAFVLAPGGQAFVVDIGATAQVDLLVERWRAAISAAPRDTRENPTEALRACRERGAALRKVIWDPIEPLIGTATQVFIVPDGALNLVAFAGLPGSSKEYLIEEGRVIQYLSAERDLVRPRAPPDEGTRLMVLADPDFDAGSVTQDMPPAQQYANTGTRGIRLRFPCNVAALAPFQPLPGTRVEAQGIASIWNQMSSGKPAVTLLLGRDATEERLKAQARTSTYLHIATHGFFLAECRVDRAGHVVNALLRAGLICAGANQLVHQSGAPQDGVLFATEIATMNLQHVRLAVLSACDTGVGEVEVGEGVLGLRRAFALAGVRTLVMSLWAVSDEATQQWMQEFYENQFARGMGTAFAAHRATLSILNERRGQGLDRANPFYWASFVAVGPPVAGP